MEDGEDDSEDEGDVLVIEDEDMIPTDYCNGNREVVKMFNQTCVIRYERDSA